MLIPRYSLRTMLGLMTAFGLLFLVISMAVRGHEWALAVVLAIASLAIVFLAFAGQFLVVWLFAQGARLLSRSEPGSPFAQGKPPPQILSPTDPD
jgi:uncharacterized membrane protein